MPPTKTSFTSSSFYFDNSKDENHLISSLIQELVANTNLDPQSKLKTTILKTFFKTDLIFNFDLGTQLKLSNLYEITKEHNNYSRKNKINSIYSIRDYRIGLLEETIRCLKSAIGDVQQ